MIGAIGEHEDRLEYPARVLYEYLTEGETDATPEDLRKAVDEESQELDFAEAELLAHAGLLDGLQELYEEA